MHGKAKFPALLARHHRASYLESENGPYTLTSPFNRCRFRSANLLSGDFYRQSG
jgi:hypothetical protein